MRMKCIVLSLFSLVLCLAAMSVRADAVEKEPAITYPVNGSIVDQRDVAEYGFKFQLKDFPEGITTVTLKQGTKTIWQQLYSMEKSFEIVVPTGPKTFSTGSFLLTCSHQDISKSVSFTIEDKREPEVTWEMIRQQLLDTIFRGNTLVTWSPYRTLKVPDMAMSAVLAELDALAATSTEYWTYGDGYVQLFYSVPRQELLDQMLMVRQETRNALLMIMDEPIRYTREQMLLNIQRYLSAIGSYDEEQPQEAYPMAQHSGWYMMTTGRGVCSSFASIGFEMVLACDIPVKMKIARTKDGNSAHAWLMVQMEDGKWYNLDFTWNNTDIRNPSGEDELVRLNWFLVSDASHAKEFVWDNDLYPDAPEDYPVSVSRTAPFSTGFRYRSPGEPGLATLLVKVGAASEHGTTGAAGEGGSDMGPGAEPVYFGPGAEPAYFGPGAEPAYYGPGAEPAYYGPGAEPACFGPGAEPAYYGPGAEPACFGPG